jgi:hypothetical protein
MGFDQAAYCSQGGCFSRAIRPDQGYNLAFLNSQGDAFESMDFSIIGVKVIDFQECHWDLS